MIPQIQGETAMSATSTPSKLSNNEKITKIRSLASKLQACMAKLGQDYKDNTLGDLATTLEKRINEFIPKPEDQIKTAEKLLDEIWFLCFSATAKKCASFAFSKSILAEMKPTFKEYHCDDMGESVALKLDCIQAKKTKDKAQDKTQPLLQLLLKNNHLQAVYEEYMLAERSTKEAVAKTLLEALMKAKKWDMALEVAYAVKGGQKALVSELIQNQELEQALKLSYFDEELLRSFVIRVVTAGEMFENERVTDEDFATVIAKLTELDLPTDNAMARNWESLLHCSLKRKLDAQILATYEQLSGCSGTSATVREMNQKLQEYFTNKGEPEKAPIL